jgi:hypothetical protein
VSDRLQPRVLAVVEGLDLVEPSNSVIAHESSRLMF